MKKEKTTKAPVNELVQKLLEGAIPVSSAKFHAAVDNSIGTPTNYFSEDSQKAERRAKMWASYSYLIVQHDDTYILVPLSNVIAAPVK